MVSSYYFTNIKRIKNSPIKIYKTKDDIVIIRKWYNRVATCNILMVKTWIKFKSNYRIIFSQMACLIIRQAIWQNWIEYI